MVNSCKIPETIKKQEGIARVQNIGALFETNIVLNGGATEIDKKTII